MSNRIRRSTPDHAGAVAALSRIVCPARPEPEEDWRRGAEEPDQPRHFVAERSDSGDLIGYACLRPDLPLQPQSTKFRLHLGVAEPHRGAGVGADLYRTVLERAASLGATALRARVRPVTEPSLFAFLQRRGFTEDHRIFHLERQIVAGDDRLGGVPDGLTIVTLADELLRDPNCPAALHTLQNLCFADTPYYAGDPFVAPSFEQFEKTLKDPLILPDGFFLAVCDGRYVGLSYMAKDPEDASRLHQRYTGVHPDYRRQGVALALKQATIRYAHRHGYDRIKTTTASPGMLAVNRQVGFEPTAYEARMQLLL